MSRRHVVGAGHYEQAVDVSSLIGVFSSISTAAKRAATCGPRAGSNASHVAIAKRDDLATVRRRSRSAAALAC